MAALSTESSSYTAFYFSYAVEQEEQSVHSFDDEQEYEEEEDTYDDEEEDFYIRISQKRRSDEALFLDNLRRRKLRFSEQPSVKEFEPAPESCRTDMYYTCHQLQKMMDAYHEGREFHLEE